MCTHEGLVAFQRDLDVRLGARPGHRVAQFMSAAFDGSIHEIFSCLCYGATLVLRNDQGLLDHLKLADSAILTPSIASHLEPTDFPSLKTASPHTSLNLLFPNANSSAGVPRWRGCSPGGVRHMGFQQDGL